MFIKEALDKGHPGFRIINLSTGATMLLAYTTNSSFLMVSLPNY